MGLALRLARRSLLRHRARALFSVAGIAVGIATVVGVFALDYNTLIGRARSNDPDWQAEIEVSPSAQVSDPKGELALVPGVERIVAAFQTEVTLRREGSPPETAERVAFVALEVESARGLDTYHVQRGRDLGDDDTRAEVLVGSNLAERLGLEPGSRLLLGVPPGAARRECVGGQWRSIEGDVELPAVNRAFEVVGVLAREGLGRRASGDVVVCGFRAGSSLFANAHIETHYWLGRDAEVNLERLQTSLGRAWSYDLQKSVVIGQAADERAFRNGVRFAGLLALVLGLYVIFHTLSVSLVERVREVGVLHALGATRAQIGRVFLAEAALLAGLGGAAGFAGGLGLARFLLRHGVTTVGTGLRIYHFEIPWGTCLTLTALGVGIALLGSVFPLLRARHTDVVHALRGEEPEDARGPALGFRLLAAVLLAAVLPALYFGVVPLVGEAQRELVGVLLLGVGVLALFVGVPLVVPALIGRACVLLARPCAFLWPLAGRLAVRAMARGPARVAGAVAGLALVTAAYVGLRGMTASLQAEIEVWGREAFLDKVFVRNAPRTTYGLLSVQLMNEPGVLSVEPNEARTYVPFLMVGVVSEDLTRFGPLADDPGLLEPMRSGRGAIVSRRLANHRGYAVGDLLHVRTPRDEVVDLPVLAISDAYGYFPHPDERLYALVDASWMNENFCLDSGSVTSFSVRLSPGVSSDVVRRAVRELIPSGSITFETGDYLYRWHTSDVDRDFVLFDILIALSAALAALGILNGQLLATMERAGELGVLRALGVSRSQVAGMVLIESAVVGLLGGGLGVALGALLTPMIVAALAVISGLPLPHASAGAALLLGPLGALALALAAGFYPVWRAQRVAADQAVRGAQR